MKAASILLAVFAVLGFLREAGASHTWDVEDSWTFQIGEEFFGFTDIVGWDNAGQEYHKTTMQVGPLGACNVPFTTRQGLVGFCLIFALLFIVLVVLTVRWKKKRATS